MVYRHADPGRDWDAFCEDHPEPTQEQLDEAELETLEESVRVVYTYALEDAQAELDEACEAMTHAIGKWDPDCASVIVLTAVHNQAWRNFSQAFDAHRKAVEELESFKREMVR